MKQDIIGREFGYWTVLKKAEGSSMYLCRCRCGTERSVRSSNLTSEKSTSCGCRKLKMTGTGDADGKRRIENILKRLGGVQIPREEIFRGEQLVPEGYTFTYAKQFPIEDDTVKRCISFCIRNGRDTPAFIEYTDESHFRLENNERRGNGHYSRSLEAESAKEAYCRSNGFPLLRIYYDTIEDAEETIKAFLSDPAAFPSDYRYIERQLEFLHEHAYR